MASGAEGLMLASQKGENEAHNAHATRCHGNRRRSGELEWNGEERAEADIWSERHARQRGGRQNNHLECVHASTSLAGLARCSSPGVDSPSRTGFGVEGGRGVEGGLGFELLECRVRGGGGGGRGFDELPLLAASSVRRLLPVSGCERPGEGPAGSLGRGWPFDDGLSLDDDRP